VLATRGAAHSQSFEVECLIPQLSVRTTGSGSSRRTAEQEAAMRAFERVRG
jgi:ribonuclease-3